MTLDIRPSRYFIGLNMALILGAAVSVMTLSIATFLQCILLFLLLSSGVFFIHRYCWSNKRITRVVAQSQGWLLYLNNGEQQSVVVSPQSIVTRYLIILYFPAKHGWHIGRSVCLFSDSASVAVLRCLRLQLLTLGAQ